MVDTTHKTVVMFWVWFMTLLFQPYCFLFLPCILYTHVDTHHQDTSMIHPKSNRQSLAAMPDANSAVKRNVDDILHTHCYYKQYTSG